MKNLLLILVLTLVASFTASAGLEFQPSDTMATVLKRQVGQRVEVRLTSGEKLAGKVAAVGETTVHLSALTGQEFFDAVVVLDDISAVVVRAGGN